MDDGLEQSMDGLLPEDPPDLIEPSLIESLAPTVKVLPRLENPVIDRPLDAQGRPHFDHALTHSHRDLLRLAGLVIGDGDALDEAVVKPSGLKTVRQNQSRKMSPRTFS